MSDPLPTIGCRAAVGAFERLGFEMKRQTGSHVIMAKEGHEYTLSVPNHKTLKKGTLRGLIRASGHTIQEFVDQL